jgi:mannosyltransferase
MRNKTVTSYYRQECECPTQRKSRCVGHPPAQVFVYIALAAITLAALVMRLWLLTDRDIWYDESVSISIARLNWTGLWEVVTHKEANSALYYALLKLWLYFGHSPAWLRGLSLIAGVATVPLIFAVGRRLFGTSAGLFAAAMLAVNAYHVRYSQETRGYALLAFFCVAGTWAFVRAVERPTWRNWALYGALMTAGAYTHFFAGLVMAAHYISLLALPRMHWPLRWLLITASVVFASVVPLFLFIAFRDSGQIAWIPRPGWAQIYFCLFDMAGPTGLHRLGHIRSFPANILLRLYLLVSAITFIAAGTTFRRMGRSGESWHSALIISWTLVPVLVALAISLKKPLFLTRYFIVSLPAWVLLAGMGLSRLRRAWLVAPLLGSILLFAISGNIEARQNQFDPPYHPWKRVATYVLSQARPGDAIIFFHPYGALPFDYYRRELKYPSNIPEVIYPFRTDGLLLSRDSAIDRELWPDTALFRRVGQHQRVWYVMPTSDDIGRRVGTVLSEMYPRVTTMDAFAPIHVYRYER